MYNLRIKNFGINASANYKINTVNKQEYKYGNKLATNLIAYYRLNARKVGISPNAGIGYENVASNLLSSKEVQYTGSNVTNAIMGVEFTFHKIGLGLNAQLPVAQNFAQGQTQLKFKGIAHITFAL
jgi:flagellar capping protein FliD